MTTKIVKYCEALRRLKKSNPRLDRTMLEASLRVLYGDELENVKLNVSDIYNACEFEAHNVDRPKRVPETANKK
jgi:hypothetical protein